MRITATKALVMRMQAQTRTSSNALPSPRKPYCRRLNSRTRRCECVHLQEHVCHGRSLALECWPQHITLTPDAPALTCLSQRLASRGGPDCHTAQLHSSPWQKQRHAGAHAAEHLCGRGVSPRLRRLAWPGGPLALPAPPPQPQPLHWPAERSSPHTRSGSACSWRGGSSSGSRSWWAGDGGSCRRG